MTADVITLDTRKRVAADLRTHATTIQRAAVVAEIVRLIDAAPTVSWGRRAAFPDPDVSHGSWGPIHRAFKAVGVELTDAPGDPIIWHYTMIANLLGSQFVPVETPEPGDVCVYQFPVKQGALSDRHTEPRIAFAPLIVVRGPMPIGDEGARLMLAGTYPCTHIKYQPETPWFRKRRLATFRLTDRVAQNEAA